MLSPASTISATVVNGVDLGGTGNSSSTAEGFGFDPEIGSLIHQLWKDPAALKIVMNFT
jgi:hypothetical protein